MKHIGMKHTDGKHTDMKHTDMKHTDMKHTDDYIKPNSNAETTHPNPSSPIAIKLCAPARIAAACR